MVAKFGERILWDGPEKHLNPWEKLKQDMKITEEEDEEEDDDDDDDEDDDDEEEEEEE